MPLTPDDLQARLALAITVAREAGAHLRGLYAQRGTLVVEQKGINDFVSRADREAEDMIRAAVARAFPADGFVGEESGPSGIAQAPAVWVVDPLDGTTNFLKGAHYWCVSIAVVVDERPTIGVVYDPLRDELFDGLVGQGSRLNGQPIAVSSVADMTSATIGLSFVERVGADQFVTDTRTILATGLRFRQFGAGALMLAYVAAGRIDAYFERHAWPWDALGGLALIEAAGGMTTPYPADESMLRGWPVLAAGPALYRQIDRLVAL